MIRFKKTLSIVISALFLVKLGTALAGDITSENYQARLEGLDDKVEKVIDDFNLPGIAIAVVAGGKVIKIKGYGFRDLEKKLPVTENTQFSIGSSTKAFTSFVIGTLVDEGKLDWYKPVKEYLPHWQMQTPYATENTNLIDILSHRSGLARHELIWLANPELNIEMLLEKLPFLEFSNKGARQEFIYNNLLYGVAGHIAETVSSQKWETLVQSRILDKLEMSNTSLTYFDMVNAEDYALPYIEREQRLLSTSFNQSLSEVMRPAGSINSSVKDMSKWLQVLVEEGRFQQKELIQRNTLFNIQSPHISISGFNNDSDKSPMHYGLGWFARTYRGHYQVQHGGNVDGFTSAVFTYPNEDIGIVVLTNKNYSPVPYSMSLDISEMLLTLEPRHHLNALLKKMTANGDQNVNVENYEPTRQSSVALAAYTGTFHHQGYGEIKILEVEGGLELEYIEIKERFVASETNNFFSKNTHPFGIFESGELIFNQGKDGEVVSVQVPFDSSYPITFNRNKERKICFFWCVN